MEHSEIVQNNIEGKLVHKACEKEGHDLDDIRIIYRKCKCCGKMVVCPDPEFVAQKGVMGRG